MRPSYTRQGAQRHAWPRHLTLGEFVNHAYVVEGDAGGECSMTPLKPGCIEPIPENLWDAGDRRRAADGVAQFFDVADGERG
jgi:hypothetical protein